MIIYWIVFFVLAFVCVLFPNFTKNKDYNINFYLFTVVVLVLLTLFAGLRLNSNDYDGYVKIYYSIPSLNEISKHWIDSQTLNVEIGFIILCSFLKLFSSNPILLFLVSAALSVGLNVVTIRKISPYIFLSILIYFVYNFLLKETIQIRQGIASALVMYSFLFYKNRFKSILIILFACMIQSTAWIALMVMFFSRVKFKSISSYYKIIGVTFAAAFIFSGRHLFEFLLGVMNLPPSLTAYFGWEEFDYNLGFFNPVLIKQIIICFLLIVNKEKLSKKFTHFVVIFNYYFISTLWYIYFNDFAIIAGRIANLLSVGEVVLIPMLLFISSPRYKLITFVIIIIYCALVLFLNLKSGKIFPYQTVF